MNQFCGSGRLVRDAEKRSFNNGGAVTKFTIALEVYRKKDSDTGKWTTKSSFLECAAFNRGEHGTLADQAATLRKGQPVMVAGKLDQEEWKNTEGKKITKIVLAVDEIFAEMEKNAEKPAPAYAEDSPF